MILLDVEENLEISPQDKKEIDIESESTKNEDTEEFINKAAETPNENEIDNENTKNTELTDEKKETVETNCLALTVRKDYSLSIWKNSFITGLRVSWKIAISTSILNLLKFLF